ncbi:hypothetical protein ACEQ8H_005972 [Pleosporales sp. CAS-2024a]
MDMATSFWNRFGLSNQDASSCLKAVQEHYFGCRVEEFKEQGYCSLTLLVTPPSLIVQIRPAQHALDMSIAEAAARYFPLLAPAIQELHLLQLPAQLCLYSMQKRAGTPLSRLLPRKPALDSTEQVKHTRLVESFASAIAHSWTSPEKPTPGDRAVRADSPMAMETSVLSQCKGKVGSSIMDRLCTLSKELPDAQLRARAEATLRKLQALHDYPVVLNHGDLIPSNILVNQKTWEITGLVDWAEAEHLPFGTCLYALDNLLGYLDTSSKGASKFVYYDKERQLRNLFWTNLFKSVPGLEMRDADVKTIKDVGVLLWYGIAWDDGAINRVVNETNDAAEVACLRAFLDMA